MGQTTTGIVLETAAVVLDVHDVELEAAFWGAVLGEEPGPLRGGRRVAHGRRARLDNMSLVLQRVPERKTVKNRCHLDFVGG